MPIPAEFPTGIYTVSTDLTSLIIHNAPNSVSPEQGRFYRNDEFRVYQVMPIDKNLIIWGRVTENTEGNVLYVGLKVGANKKVQLLHADMPVPIPSGDKAIEYIKIVYTDGTYTSVYPRQSE